MSLINGSRNLGRDPLRELIKSACCWPECQARAVEVLDLPLCASHIAIVAARLDDRYLRPAAPADEPSRPGFVYFARFSDRVKIGHSTDVRTRLDAIPHDEVLAVIPGTRLDERRCHAAFADLRVQGEWFRAEPRLLEFIAGLQGDDQWATICSSSAGV